MDDEELFLGCDCHSADHIARLTYWPRDGEMYLTVRLGRGTFWERVKRAFHYVFASKPCRYGDFDEFILRPEDVARLSEFLATYEDYLSVEATKESSVGRFLYERWEKRVKKMLERKNG